MKNLKKIVVVNKKRFFLVIIVFLAVVSGAVWGILKIKNRNNPENKEQIFEALVNIVDQKVSDPIEDARSSLKKGDVIAIFPEGHSWSDTEKNSYLIVKIKLKPSEVQKMLEPVTKEVESKKPEGENPDMAKGKELETVVARKYTLDIPDYDVQKFWENQKQPFPDKIFSSGIIEKK